MKSKTIRSPHPPRIDAHVHVFARASRQFPREVSDQLPATREEPVEKLLEQMQANEISQAVLVQIGGASLEHHSYLRYCLEMYPRQFLGIGLIPTDELKPEEHMDRLATNGDVIGFRLSSIGGPADPLAPMDVRSFRTFPIWKHASERDYVIWLYPQAIDAHCLPFIIEAFPEVRVVFHHMLALPGKGSFSWIVRAGRESSSLPCLHPHVTPQWDYISLKMSPFTYQGSMPSAMRSGLIAISRNGTRGYIGHITGSRDLGQTACYGQLTSHGLQRIQAMKD